MATKPHGNKKLVLIRAAGSRSVARNVSALDRGPWHMWRKGTLVRVKNIAVIELERGILVLLAQKTIANDQHLDFRTH